MEGNQQGENNQQPLLINTLLSTTPGFFRDKDTVDVYFFFEKENKRVGAHKIILASKCDAFKAMFYGGVNEKGDVPIVEVSSEAFITFLRFFYFADVVIPIGHIAEIMYLADKYLVTAITGMCYQYLEHHVPIEHICIGYGLAIKYNRDGLVSKFEREMKSNPEILFKSESFRSCSSETLKRILKIDELMCNGDPQDVFEACIAWAMNACTEVNLDASEPENWKQQLGECFYLIPFSLMTPKEIHQIFDEYGNLFDHKETLDLMSFMIQDGENNLNKFKCRYFFWSKVYNFNTAKKMCVKKKEIFYFDAASRCVAMEPFHITHDKLLVDKLTLSGTLEIFEDNDDDKIILLKQNFSFECDNNTMNLPKIKFANAVNVEKGKKYKMQFDFDSSWSANTFFMIRGNYDEPAVVSYCIENVSDVDSGDESSDNDVEMPE